MDVGKNEVTFQVLTELPPQLAKVHAKEVERIFLPYLRDISKEEIDDRFCSQSDCAAYVVALVEDKLIGSMMVYRRALSSTFGSYVLGGLGAVYVLEKYRRRGIARNMLQMSMDEMKKMGCDVAYLATNLDKWSQLYGEVGFVALGRPHTFKGYSGKRYMEEDAMIAAVNNQDLFERIRSDQKVWDIGQGDW